MTCPQKCPDVIRGQDANLPGLSLERGRVLNRIAGDNPRALAQAKKVRRSRRKVVPVPGER